MKKLSYIFVFAILLFGLFSSTNMHTKADTDSLKITPQATVTLNDYVSLLSCSGPSNAPGLVSADVLRYDKNGLYRYRPLLIVRDQYGFSTSYSITSATWKRTNVSGKIKAIFNAGSNVKLTVEANTFEQPTSATLTMNGQTIYFTYIYQRTSGYYWATIYSPINEAFSCPESGDPQGCPGIIF